MGICLDTDKHNQYEDDGEEVQRRQSELKLQQKVNSFEEVQGEVLHIESDKESEMLSESMLPGLTDKKTIDLQLFDFLKVLGRGSFGKVLLVKYQETGQLFAMKILRKDIVEKRNQRIHTKNERLILERVQHPFIVQLHFAFQTPAKLYLITDFMIGGELFYHLRREYKFTEARAKQYITELVCALEYLHNKGIIYRDLKPENILLGQDGHIKITDFGLSKVNIKEGEQTHTYCGTPEYLAPEILLGKGHDKTVDWWSLGALLYEMLSGAPPFYSKDRNTMFKNRLEKPIEMKPWFSDNAISILQALLCNDVQQLIKILSQPKYRLGSRGAQEIKQHQFFEDIDWQKVIRKQIKPDFQPKISSDQDLRNFDPVFTDEPVKDTPVNWDINQKDTYDKFSFQKNSFSEDIKEDSYFQTSNNNNYQQ